MRVSVYAWVFRHRHGLRSIYGLPPEPRLAGLLAASRPSQAGGRTRRAETVESSGRHDTRPCAQRPEPAADAERGTDRVRQLTIRPLPRRT